MDFSQALLHLKNRGMVAREGWNGPGQYISLRMPDEPDEPGRERSAAQRYSMLTVPYAYITTAQGALIPWVPSQTDMLATDWMEVSNDRSEVVGPG